MSEMNKCQHCGVFVPVEKAFCPNCSEPMELEESPNRAHSFSSDMLATIRDDPEKYRQMLTPPVKKPPTAAAATPTTPPPQDPAPLSSPPVGYSAPGATATPPSAAAKERSFLPLIVGVVAILILVFIILYAFKII